MNGEKNEPDDFDLDAIFGNDDTSNAKGSAEPEAPTLPANWRQLGVMIGQGPFGPIFMKDDGNGLHLHNLLKEEVPPEAVAEIEARFGINWEDDVHQCEGCRAKIEDEMNGAGAADPFEAFVRQLAAAAGAGGGNVQVVVVGPDGVQRVLTPGGQAAPEAEEEVDPFDFDFDDEPDDTAKGN